MNILDTYLFRCLAGLALASVVTACGEPVEQDPGDDEQGVDPARVEQELPGLIEDANASAIELPQPRDPAKVELGRMLFFDPILSGNKDTNCATCHHPTNHTTIEGSLAVGTSAAQSDGARIPGNDHSFTPRNPPDLFNLGDPSLTTIFWDSRMERLDDGRFVMHDRTAGLAEGNYLRTIPDISENLLAAQVMFPVTDRDEMRGDYGEIDINGEINEVAQRTDIDFEGIWRDLTDRVMAIDEYREMLAEIYPSVSAEDMTFHYVANALSAFIIETFSFADSPWDEYLRGEEDALNDEQKYGAWLFFGDAGCADCHSGRLLSDQKLHNLGVRPITAGPDSDYPLDMGASHRAHAGRDKAFAFRTPTLRNVELTGPWMHNGAQTSLEGAIRQHSQMREQLWNYDYTQLEQRFWEQVHTSEDALSSVEETMTGMKTRELSPEEVDALVAFLESLTSPTAEQMTGIEPEQVPSGLPIPQP